MRNNDMSIHFDLKIVEEALEPIEINYLDFLNLDGSFLGWLLTLDKEEFDYVYKCTMHDFNKDPNGATALLLTQVECIHNNDPIITLGELQRDISTKKTMVKMISMIKEGLIEYETTKEDINWKMTLTERGKELLNGFNLAGLSLSLSHKNKD